MTEQAVSPTRAHLLEAERDPGEGVRRPHRTLGLWFVSFLIAAFGSSSPAFGQTPTPEKPPPQQATPPVAPVPEPPAPAAPTPETPVPAEPVPGAPASEPLTPSAEPAPLEGEAAPQAE